LGRGGKHGRAQVAWLVAILVASLCVISPKMSSAQSPVDEYQLKAAFLFHFAQFVEWPPDAPKDPDGSFLLCVVGEGPFHGDLERIVEGKLIADQLVRVQHIRQLEDSQGCRVVFIGANESKQISLSTASLRKMPVLTVGESDDFLRQGGIIRFCLEDRKVRFEINQQAAGDAHLKISSRLLLLAKTVVGGSAGK
jgi:hypothetical protein